MSALIDAYALPLALAGGLGLVIGWGCAGAGSRRGAALGLLAWVGLAAALAAASALAGGRLGVWAESGLMLLGTYLGACAFACGLRRLAMR